MSDFSGFYKLGLDERIERIAKHAGLTPDEVALLGNSGALKMEAADKMVENVFGAVHLPMGVATNFVINGKEYVVPMALEEPSVIAAASKAAKGTLPEGFKAEADDPVMIGQVQLVGIEDPIQALKNLDLNSKQVMEMASSFMKPHERFGCGVKSFKARQMETAVGGMIIVDFKINVGDAQGANMVNTTMEGIAPTLEKLTGGAARLRIVSNLATERKIRARAIWRKETLGEAAIQGVLEGYEMARNDVYRCATHNKGIMNGIDAVVLATGNDWRSVEAGAHAFASLGGYHPLTHYHKNEKGDLIGSIELPLALGTVGPAVSSSPTAPLALKILRVRKASELGMVMACVGLSNNLAALSALSTEGIQRGHMRLHARNIASYAGAKTPEEMEAVAAILSRERDFSLEKAKAALAKVREGRV